MSLVSNISILRYNAKSYIQSAVAFCHLFLFG